MFINFTDYIRTMLSQIKHLLEHSTQFLKMDSNSTLLKRMLTNRNVTLPADIESAIVTEPPEEEYEFEYEDEEDEEDSGEEESAGEDEYDEEEAEDGDYSEEGDDEEESICSDDGDHDQEEEFADDDDDDNGIANKLGKSADQRLPHHSHQHFHCEKPNHHLPGCQHYDSGNRKLTDEYIRFV